MEYSSLYDMISYLQYGTKLHIGVLFLGGYGNEKLRIPEKQQIHAGAICDEFKKSEGGFRRCFRCRNTAIRKAITTKSAFGGYCVNGVYEYTRPVIINDEINCIIYIGNILDRENGYERIRKKIGDNDYLLLTMEENFGFEKCEAVGKLLESYIRILTEKCANDNKNVKVSNVIENIKSYIELNLEFDIVISDVAKIFHYNEKYLGRLFKKETGMSFCDYVNTRRLKSAIRLLASGDMSVLEVSNKVGFNNVTYFNRLFKRMVGMTPTEYRMTGMEGKATKEST